MHRLSCRLICFFGIFCLLVAIFSGVTPTAKAAATETLTIRVGYFGGPFYEKEVLSVSEIESLGAYWQTFTFLDSGGFLAYATTYGVALTDILECVGVDLGTVGQCHFKTSDSASYHTSVTASTLYGSQRYAFLNLSEYYGELPGQWESGITDYDAVWQSAVPVQTVLSLMDNYSRVDEFTPYDASCYDITSNKRLRLFFGQTVPDEVNARHMAYWVYGIDVEFSGSPSIRMDKSDLSLSIGDDYTVEYSVSTADPVISEAIRNGLRWESSDPSVVTVDASGKLNVLSRGEAVITAYFDDYEISASLHIVVGDNETNGGGGEGNGQGSGSGDGEGDGANGGLGDGEDGGIGDDSGVGKDNGGEGEGDKPDNNGQNGSPDGTTSGDGAEAPSPSESTQTPATESPEQTVVVPTDKAPAEPSATEPTETFTPESAEIALKGRPFAVSNGDPDSASGGMSKNDDSGGGGGGSAIGLVLQTDHIKFYLLLGILLLLSGGGLAIWIRYKKEI